MKQAQVRLCMCCWLSCSPCKRLQGKCGAGGLKRGWSQGPRVCCFWASMAALAGNVASLVGRQPRAVELSVVPAGNCNLIRNWNHYSTPAKPSTAARRSPHPLPALPWPALPSPCTTPRSHRKLDLSLPTSVMPVAPRDADDVRAADAGQDGALEVLQVLLWCTLVVLLWSCRWDCCGTEQVLSGASGGACLWQREKKKARECVSGAAGSQTQSVRLWHLLCKLPIAGLAGQQPPSPQARTHTHTHLPRIVSPPCCSPC